MRTLLMAAAMVLLTMPVADARSSGSSSSSSRSGRVYSFRTSECKTSACMSKHPGGTYTHPLTERKN